ncbi:MAG: hypothetical protein Q8P13_02120 [bacterium]|nr:hypothetical protein [bacterium]
MNKRSLITFLIFFLVILALGTFVYFRFFSKGSDTSTQNSAKSFSLILTDAPADGSSTFEKEVVIEGSTGSDSVVVVSGGAQDTSTETTDGKFSLTYTLTEGENQINIIAFDQKTGEAKTLSREVFYSPEIKNL